MIKNVNEKMMLTVMIMISALLLAQTVSIVDATHNSGNENKAREEAEAESKEFDEKVTGKSATEAQKRKAFADYKIAFNAWKVAKENWKDAKSTGVQTDIDATKIILDAAKITKDKALKEYKEVIKKKTR